MYGIFITWAVNIKTTFIYKKNRSQSISCLKIVDVGLTCVCYFLLLVTSYLFVVTVVTRNYFLVTSHFYCLLFYGLRYLFLVIFILLETVLLSKKLQSHKRFTGYSSLELINIVFWNNNIKQVSNYLPWHVLKGEWQSKV